MKRHLWTRQTQPAHDRELLARVPTLASALQQLGDTELASRYQQLKQQNHNLPEQTTILTFALVSEAVRRALGLNYYREQLMAGLAMIRGEIVEMQTGEGKTITAVLPACWYALAERGVHVMTVNDYLAERDFETLSPVYHRLGLTAGLNQPRLSPEEKRTAYAADITYGPGYEFGFDYLRDQIMTLSQQRPRLGSQFTRTLNGQLLTPPQPVQSAHAVAIIDEADSVLIDEATVPLVLSSQGGQPADNTDIYQAARQAALTLKAGQDFLVNQQASELQITDLGLLRLSADRSLIPIERLDRPWMQYVEQALRAELFYHRDLHYVVIENRVQIVDPHTSRIFTDRTWRNGLHQAVEAKEGKPVTTESQPIARIMRQKYFQLYDQLSGMSGTVQGCQQELREVYGVRYSYIPPHRPSRRTDLPVRLFKDQHSREQAFVRTIQEMQHTHRPILAGTADIDASRRLSNMLHELGIAHQLLNGIQDAEEAAVIAAAGQPQAVTIATNLAGRGTDIQLGPGVAESGGLHVLAAGFQLTERIDRQLIGRAARKGEPGSSQILASLDDTLFRQAKSAWVDSLKQLADETGEIPVSRQTLGKITKTQRRVEETGRQRRKQLTQHDDWLSSATCSTWN
ncbi:preprotein translocase subunit SecA [Gimesia chilikensis]|uniref:preprotein translocase subunit SecA n=1 Tax=Gimesia chilikensis TaxID=2605989 RepID=UPI0011ED7FDC|nr:preprotein translocase subunit SecA [Gimesia chilikensis]KAA0133719.1 preprotein translocase subunit SecA [Gimesia chilikensis]